MLFSSAGASIHSCERSLMKDEDKTREQLIHELRQTREANASSSDEALLSSESCYRRLFESAQDGILILDFDTGQILDVNPYLIRMLGYSHEEYSGKTLWEIGFWRDRESSKNLFLELQENGYVRYEHLPLRTKEGESVEVEFVSNSYPVDVKTFIQCNIRNITDRKQAESLAQVRLSLLEYAAIHRLDELLQKTLDEIGSLTNSPIGFYHFISEDEKTISLQAWSTRTVNEFCQAEGKGQHYPVDQGGVWVDAVRDRVPVIHNDCSSLPHRKGMPEGHAAVIRELVVPVMRSDRIVAVLGIGNKPTDYTEKDVEIVSYLADVSWEICRRKRAEEALKESELRYRTLFEESRDGVYPVQRDGEITDANSSFSEIFGYTREELIGKDIRNLYADPADRPKFQEEIEKKGFVKDYAIKYRKKDGTEMDSLLTSSVYHREDGSISGYRGIVRDLTEQKRLQRELVHAQKMESVGTLAGGIAHDFNNLLTVVLGFSELLLIGKDERDPSYPDLQKIHQAAMSGADLVKRILAFSRKAEVNPRPLNLNREIERAKDLLTRVVPKMIEIELVLCDGLETVIADQTQVEQTLLNLAVNASDAMPDGGKLTIATKSVTLDEEYCRLHLGAEPGDFVMLSVSDTGHGMDHETLDHIFEPFFTTKAPGAGTGLGLAMVYGMVKQHGGYIICYSEPGIGTTFNIYLPVDPTAAKPESPIEKPIPLRGIETILLVDDEEMVRDLGKRILERFGYTVLAAANGKEAVNLYEKQMGKISLVILDLIMPEMGGKQCLEELLKIDPHVKALIASGYSAAGETKKAIEAGARAFVGKPYDIRQMLQAVREVLDAI